jgi:uracil-DNA glycosylase family 4
MTQRIVKGNGAEDAEIMVVTDYPSKEELTSGKAGVGYVGRMLGSWFREASYDISKCYVTSYVKTEFTLPRAKNKQEEALSECLASFKPDNFGKILSEEIAEIKPNVIISAGEYSTRYLTGRKNVQKLRGSILPVCDLPRLDLGDASKIPNTIRVIPIIHPRDVNQKHIHSVYTSLDVQRAVKYRTRRDPYKEPGNLWICWKASELSNWWSDRGWKGRFLTVDIETYLNFITCISFCTDGKEALSIPLLDKRTLPIDRALLLKGIAKILSSKIPKVNQNIDFDDDVLGQWGIRVENIYDDTMLLGHTIYPELPKGLDFYTSIYTEIPYYKDDGRDFNPREGWDTLYYYNAKDALSTWQVYAAQEKDARESGIWSFYREKVWPLFNIYKRLDKRGILIDPVEQRVLFSKYSQMLQDQHASLERMVGHEINYNSPKAVADVVFNELGYPEQFKVDRKTGIRSLTTGEETLEELILNHSRGEVCDNILWKFLWCRKLKKVVKLILVPYHLDGRMRTNSKLTGTKSGRTSMSKTIDRIYYKNTKDHPLYKKTKKLNSIVWASLGLSFQTIGKHGFKIVEEDEDEDEAFESSYEIQGVEVGKDIRRMYVPSRGYTLVEGDGGQAEARAVCVLAEDWETLAEMERKDFKVNQYGLKDDLHTKTAMLVLNKEFDDITEQDRQDFGKKPRHAGNYDMGAARLALMAHISLQQSQITLTRFHSASPKIRENFHFWVRSVVTNRRVLESPHGRVRQFFDKLNNETYKQAYSFIPQAIVSDHTKMTAISGLVDEGKKWHDTENVYLLAESHDSALFEVKDECVDDFLPDFKAAMETPIRFDRGTFVRDRELIIPGDFKVSKSNWFEMQKVKGF